jgi:hypothetical protein
MLKFLLSQFVKKNGRTPNAIEMLQLKFKASQQVGKGEVVPFPRERITDWTKARPQPPEIEIIDGVQTTRGMGDLFERQMKNIGKKDPALYEDRGGNIIPAQFEIHPTSEIAKSLRLEAEAAKKLKNMSEAEIKLRGNRPYDTDEQIIARIKKQNKEAAERLRNKKNKDPDEPEGFYQGGQAQIEPDLSDIGHGSDALMARNMQLSPGSQATTSTGLNYLLGEDNDTTRVPYKNAGPVILPKPKPKPKADPMVELQRIYDLYQEVAPGVAQETQKYLQQDFINKLNEANISQEQFMTNRMQNNFANGGRIGFKGGGSDASTTSFSQSYDRQHGTNTASRANKTVDARQAAGQRDADRTNNRIAANQQVAQYELTSPQQGGIFNSIKNNRFINNPFTRGALRVGAYTYNPALMGTDLRTMMQLKDVYNNTKNIINNPSFEEEDMTLGIVSEQQQKEIDKQAKMANLMNDTGKLTDIEKNTIFESVKPFDDQGSKGIFGIGATEPSPMTQSEFDTYVEEKGYAEGGSARQGFKMGKRAFLKMLGGVGAGIAGLKTGLLGLGKGAGKEVVKEVAKEAATGGAPPHFLKLVAKIKALGDDVTETAATAERQNVKQYKDFEMTEDVSTGEIQIFKNSQSDEAIDRFANENATEEVFMRYKPGKGQADETTKGKTILDEYEENTSYISNKRENTGEILEEISGVPDDIFKEVGETVPEIIRKTKADGGRIGYAGGKKVVQGLASLIKKKFGKKAITTADKLKTPQKTLDREMFSKFKDRNPDPKRQITDDEFQDLMEEVGDLDAYNFDGTIGSANKIRKEAKDYQDYMYRQYKMGKLDPEAGDKSPARKKFLEKKMEESLMSGDSKLMTREEIDELYNFDLGTEMDKMKTLPEIDDKLLKNYNKEIKAGVDDVMSDTSPAGLAKSIEIDNLMLKYPGMDKNLADQIASSSPRMKADMIAMVEQTFKMSEKGMSGDDIIQTFKNTTRRKQATGGLASMLGE